MSRALVLTVVSAIGVGLLGAVFFADGDMLAVRVWAGASLIWLTGVASSALANSAERQREPRRPMWRRARPVGEARRAPVLRSSDREVATSLVQARAFDTRLRPRLRRLIAHTNLDPVALDAARWIHDDQVGGRTPSVEDLDQTLTALERRR